MIRYYGLHTRLLIVSFGLKMPSEQQGTESSAMPELIWSGHSIALEMLALFADPAVTHLTYFVQDSVHVMAAYAAVFLVKVSHLV